MEVRLSPYNSPFIPYSAEGVYWLGLEHQHAHHTAHVKCFMDSRNAAAQVYLGLRSAHIKTLAIANTAGAMDDQEYADLCDLYFKHGVQAAGKRLGYL